jgi:hypothetical protein
MIRRFVLLALVLIGCANASALFDDAHQKDDASTNIPHADASHTTDGAPPIDAPMNDAAPPADAAVPPDAGGGQLCGDNTGCGAGTCCYFFVCTPGTGVGTNLCFPS